MKNKLKNLLDSLHDGTSAGGPRVMSRRDFLGLTCASAVVVTPIGEVIALGAEHLGPLPPQFVEDPPQPLYVIRADDLLIIEFFFVNLKLRSGAGVAPKLIRTPQPPGAPALAAYLIAQFPPQHLGEEIFENSPGPERQAQKRISNPSRLVFRIPPEVAEIDYTLKALLEACLNPDYELNLPPAAVPTGQTPNPPPPLRKPTDYGAAVPPETAIELPYRLILAPVSGVKWEHAAGADTQTPAGGATELWHTRMSGRAGADAPDELRAVWARDSEPAPPQGNPSFRMLPQASDRQDIVRATTDFSSPAKSRNVIKAERLMMSALGGWLKARFTDDSPDVSLAEWVQDTALGRDQYVKMVRRGFLYPYGHRATFLEIAERTYESRVPGDQEENLVAHLREHLYIVLMDFEKVYTPGGDSPLPHGGRGFPFGSVRFTVEKSPEIMREAIPGVDTRFACWPMLNGRPYGFPLSAVDKNEQTILFDSPVIFVAVDITPQDFQRVVESYRNKDDAPDTAGQPRPKRSAVRMRNQNVAFAPSLPRPANSPKQDTKTAFEAVTITFDIEQPNIAGPLPSNNPFQPRLKEARVQIPALKQLIGEETPTRVEYPQVYLDHGFNGLDGQEIVNKGQVFLKAVEAGAKADFSKAVKDAGGLVTPTFQLAGLSRLTGLVGGVPQPPVPLPTPGPLPSPFEDALETFRKGKFDPAKFFDDEAKLLGGLRLKDLLKPFDIGDGSTVPKITTQALVENNSTLQTGVESRLHWEKPIAPDDASAVPIFVPGPGAKIELTTVVRKSFVGDRRVTQEVECVLHDFAIALIRPVEEFVTVSFKRLTYLSRTGDKPKVRVAFGGVTFSAKLNFVKELGSLFNPGGKGPRISIDGLGLLASYNFPFPTLTMGAFSLQNLSLHIGFRLPFDGQPIRLDLGVGERRNPFLVTVGIFGGGGYFMIGLSPNGVTALEIGIEFGGNFILEIPGLAAGHVYLLAGIIFSLERTDVGNVARVTGYVRCGGELRVLGIITVSVMFYMGLTYDSGTRTFTGRASVTVEIDIAFFSVSVELSIERKFGGDGSAFLRGARDVELASVGTLPSGVFPARPQAAHSVENLLERSDWEDYCAAFA